MKTTGFDKANGNLQSQNGNKIPIHLDEKNKIVTTCWELTPEELHTVLTTRRIFVCSIVGDGKELQPTLLKVSFP